MDAQLKIAVVLAAFDKMSAVVNKAVTNAQTKLQSLSKTTNSYANSSFDFGKKAGAVGVGLGLMLLGPIKAAADMEKYNIALRTSFQGNEVAATAAFKTINDFAAKTPYELQEVLQGFIKLKNMGLDPSTEALTAYGNTASAMGKSLNEMVEAVADAATGEFERLKEFGIKANSEGKKVTFTFQGVKTTVGKNAKEIEAYLKKVGLTKFAGGIEAQSKSIYGQWSTLMDGVRMTAAKAGTTLVPLLNRLFKAAAPIIDKIAAWVEANPELTFTILKLTAAAAALSLAVSGVSFVFGGLFKAVSVFSSVGGGALNVVKFLTDKNKGLAHWVFVARYRFVQLSGFMTSTAGPAIARFGAMMGTMFKTMGTALASFGRMLLANPVILIITGIAVAAFLIYKYWDQIKAFFIRLWDGVKKVFLATWEFLKRMFLNYTPHGLIIKHWDKIAAFFGGLWERVKKIFVGFFSWFVNLHKLFFNAGVNIIKSITSGILSFINKPYEAIKKMVQKVRNLLPFSPAKDGPLRDIHKIRLVETIAESIRPNAAVQAMRRVTGAVFNVAARPGGSPLSAGSNRGGGNMNFNFEINVTGGASKEDAGNIVSEIEKRLPGLLKRYGAQQSRVSFS